MPALPGSELNSGSGALSKVAVPGAHCRVRPLLLAPGRSMGASPKCLHTASELMWCLEDDVQVVGHGQQKRRRAFSARGLPGVLEADAPVDIIAYNRCIREPWVMMR